MHIKFVFDRNKILNDILNVIKHSFNNLFANHVNFNFCTWICSGLGKSEITNTLGTSLRFFGSIRKSNY